MTATAGHEDGVGGLDLHRNHPANWRPEREATGRMHAVRAGEYPTSEPETRARVVRLTATRTSVSRTHGHVGADAIAWSVHLRAGECMHRRTSSSSSTLIRWDCRSRSTRGGIAHRTYATRGGRNPVTRRNRSRSRFRARPRLRILPCRRGIWYGDEIWNGGRERDY